MTRDHRQMYRVHPWDRQPVTIEVQTQSGDVLTGPVVELSLAGLAATFPRAPVTRLRMGERVTTRLNCAAFLQPIEGMALVQSRRDEIAECRFGFKFESPREVARQLPTSLFELFNQRKAYRVHVPEHAPVPVDIRVHADCVGLPVGEPEDPAATVEELRIEGRLRDVSTNGAAVDVEPEDEQLFAWVDLVEVSFELPEGVVQFTARVADRRLFGRSVVYGLEFDERLTESFAVQQSTVFDYVVQRQRAELEAEVR